MVKVTLIDLNDCQAENCLPIKFSLYCPDFLGSQARPDLLPPARSLPGKPSRTARPAGGGHKQQPGPERPSTRPYGCSALLLAASKDQKDGDCNEISSLVVWFMIA